MLDRRDTLKALLTGGLGAGLAAKAESAGAQPASMTNAGRRLMTLDMVQPNPGAADPDTHYLDPAFLAERGYGAEVIEHAIEGVATFAAYDPGLITPDSDEGKLAATLKAAITERIRLAKARGLKAYAWIQYVVLPKRLLAKHGAAFVDAQGRLDVRNAATQVVIRAFTAEILAAFPQLDGLVVRTGEVYLHDLPYHGSTVPHPGDAAASLIQAATAITHGELSHRALIGLLRDEVCVKAGKKLFYRTWDFGDNFHNNPKYYLDVTNAIEPHANLCFSIKHQRGDFHRLTPFNPTLTTGRHAQIIEVECQLEGYGKGAHPYYVGQGVMDGWEEYDWLMPRGAAQGIRDIAANPLISGVWTWSRGGGWDGPYIQDELWCDLNAYVLTTYGRDTKRTEASIFEQYATEVLHLDAADAALLRDISLISAKAVLRGQLTNLGAAIDVWWARDDTLSAPDLHDFVDKGLVEAAIAEKQDAVRMWTDIETNMRQIRFASPSRQAFAEVSASYGRLKYAIIAEGWTAILLAADGKANGALQTERIRGVVGHYDSLWQAWRQLKADHPICSTLPNPTARGGSPGLGAAMDRLRQV